MEYERALVVFAHPDDAEFLCGGTIAKWVSEGTEVRYVCATDGSAGWNGPERSRAEISEIRKREMGDAAEALGVVDVRFLEFVDGSLEVGLPLRRAIAREVRRSRPDVIVTFDPSVRFVRQGYVNHPDHRAVGDAVLAVVACDAPTRPQFPELIDEGFEPFKVRALWLATEEDADTKVDIGDTIKKKVEAVEAHRSQIENMGDFDVEARLREWGARVAADDGMELAESFRTFRLED
jgi:LmbE family N-acetylglucosaminyl deacetylase